jgi:hypothetical protein
LGEDFSLLRTKYVFFSEFQPQEIFCPSGYNCTSLVSYLAFGKVRIRESSLVDDGSAIMALHEIYNSSRNLRALTGAA